MYLFLLLLATGSVVAQNVVKQNNVTISSNLAKSLEGNSDALVLSELGVVDFSFDAATGFSINEKITRTIQINTTEGIGKARLTIPYYSGKYAKEDVEIKEYKISRSVNNEVVIIKIQKADNRKIGTDFYIKEIDVDDIHVGDIIEYTYVIQKNVIDEIPTWFFQSDMPKLKSVYTVKIPDNLTYLISSTGSVEVKKTEEVSTTTRIASLGGFGDSFRYKEAVVSFTALNVAAIQPEPFSGLLNNELSSVRFDLIQFQYPNNPSVEIPYKEADVAKDIYRNRSFGSDLNQVKFMQKNLVLDEWQALEPKQRITTVVQAIQARVKWNGEYNYLAKEGVKQAFLQKTGNSADLNLMLIASLKAVDIAAEPVVLSTRMNGKTSSLFARFVNQVVARVQVDGKFILIDATDVNTMLGMLPIEDLNGDGWLINEKYAVSKVSTTPTVLSINQDSFLLQLGIDGHVTGTMKNNKTMYESYIVKSQFEDDLVQKNRADIERRSNALFLKNGTFKESKDLAMEFTFDVQQFGFATKTGNKLLFKPLEYYREKVNPFIATTRDLDIDFIFPSMEDYVLELKIPEGYSVVGELKPINLVSKETGLKFYYNAEVVNDTTIRFKSNMRISKPIISKDDYTYIHAFYTELYKIIEQQVVLEKK